MSAEHPSSPAPHDDAILARVRAEVVSTDAYFNHAGMSLPPAPVLARVHEHLDLEAERGGYHAAVEVGEELASVPRALAPLFGPAVRAEEVAVTESATRAWELVLWSMAESFDFGPGDRVVVDRFTYATTWSALQALRAARRVEPVVAPSRSDGTVDPDGLAELLDERVRVVAITHVPTHLGTVTDAEAVGRTVSGHGAVYVLDVSQSLGQIALDVGRYRCHVAFAPGRKFLRAPRGTAALYVAGDLADRLVPLSPGFGVVDDDDLRPSSLAAAARRFDAFEFAVAERLGLGVAARYAVDVGLERIERLVDDRSRQVAAAVEATPGLRLLAEGEVRGIVSAGHDRLSPERLVQHLAADGVLGWVNPVGGSPLDGAARPVLPSVRLSPHYFTSDHELDRLRASLRSVPALA